MCIHDLDVKFCWGIFIFKRNQQTLEMNYSMYKNNTVDNLTDLMNYMKYYPSQKTNYYK